MSGVLLVRRDHLRLLRCVRRLLPSRPLALHPFGVFRLLLGPQLPGVSYTGSSGLGSYHGVSYTGSSGLGSYHGVSYTGSSGLGSYLGVSYTGSSGLGSSSDSCWVPSPAWTAVLGSRLTPPRLLALGFSAHGSRFSECSRRSWCVVATLSIGHGRKVQAVRNSILTSSSPFSPRGDSL